MMDGSDIFSVRFYRGLKEVWAGFSKNAFGAMDYSWTMLAVLLGIGFALFILPYYKLLVGLLNAHVPFFPSLQVLLITFIRTHLSLRFKSNPLWALLHPLSVGLGLLILLNSARMALLNKGCTWKERVYTMAYK